MILLPSLGGLLLVTLVLDVLLTVFPPVGHGGPIHRRQGRLVWSVFRALGRG